MGKEFDPYQQWLGIAPEERPVNHYRLLGIRLFEGDRQEVTAAADRLMRAIRKHQTGPRGAATQQILNEISNAKLCLLDDAARPAYDEMLRGLAAATDSAEGSRAAGYEINTPIQVGLPNAVGRHTVRPYYQQPWFPLAAIAAVAGIALLVWFTGRAIRTSSATRASHPSPLVTSPDPPRPNTNVVPQPIPVKQEASGQINLFPALAVLQGNTLGLAFLDADEVLQGWAAESDVARWRFVIHKLPPQGVFRLQITYSGGEGGAYSIEVGDSKVVGYTRESDMFVTDEHFLQVGVAGEQELLVRAAGASRLRVKRISLAFPNPTASR